MPSLKDVQRKIQSIKKTKQITKAMNMVATSRLRGAQAAIDGFRPYAEKFVEILSNLTNKKDEGEKSKISVLLTPKDNVTKIHIVLCTSDRGLCGGFNINLINLVSSFIEEKRREGISNFSFTAFGKKGFNWAKKNGFKVNSKYLGVVGSKIPFSVASTVGNNLVDCFCENEFDEVYVVYSKFVNMSKQSPIIKMLLPISIVKEKVKKSDINNVYQAEHIYEPSPESLLNDLLPKSLCVQLHNALLETSTSEHAARLTAMDNATNACNDMIKSLTLAYNKARQAAITSDLMDIVGGAEALKG